ncbi:MAG: hypothetical protein E7224_01155 [Clostridiales bacterium]|nr:hypothetical protein [Clostridiales bacterium]
MHTLIVGNSDAPRLAFIDRLLDSLRPDLPVYGYRSVKEAEQEDGRAPIYIYPARGAWIRTEENLAGWCKARKSETYPEVFDRYAAWIEEAGEDGLLLLDELGPMESKSPRFCQAVLAALEKESPILAVVRDKDTTFLKQVREHANTKHFFLTTGNSEELFPEVLAFLRLQLQNRGK